MPRQLYRLVYYSRNRIEGQAKLESEIRSVLASSRKNNAPAEITGALMFNAGCFAQVLEGRREVIESTFERIQQDDRHGDVSLLAFEPIAERIFGDWSMGFVGARPGDAEAFADIAAATGFDPSRATGDEVLDMLKQLAIEEDAVSA